MVAISEIEQLSRKIAAELDVEKIILFGSYADGTATKDSDIDLFVIVNTNLPPDERYVAVRKIAARFPASFDMVVRTPEEYEKSRSVLNTVAYFADKYGRVLYEQR